jgi:hypothetical protein
VHRICGEGGRCSTCSRNHTRDPGDQSPRRTRAGDIAAQAAAAAARKQQEDRLSEPFQPGKELMLTEKTNPPANTALADKIAACKQNELVFKRVSGKALSAKFRGFDKGWWENNPEKASKWVTLQFNDLVQEAEEVGERTQSRVRGSYSKEDYNIALAVLGHGVAFVPGARFTDAEGKVALTNWNRVRLRIIDLVKKFHPDKIPEECCADVKDVWNASDSVSKVCCAL